MRLEHSEALSFLSSVSDDADLCERAQEIFDDMYENWAVEDDEDLEPTVEIYNLLLTVYANCGDMKTASSILSKMEDSENEGVPSADMNTHIAIMEGFGKRDNLQKAEEVLSKMRIEFDPSLVLAQALITLLYEITFGFSSSSPVDSYKVLKCSKSAWPASAPSTFSFAVRL